MSVKRRGNRWWIRFRHNGQTIQKSAYKILGRDCSKKEAEQIEARLKIQVATGKVENPDWDSALGHWVNNEMRQLAGQKKLVGHIRAIEKFVAGKTFKDTKAVVQDIKRDSMERELSNNTTNKRLSIMRRVANLSEREWGWVDRAPLVTLMPPKPSRENFLERQEIEAFSELMPKTRDALWLAVWTGLRHSHLFKVTIDDLIGRSLVYTASDTKNAKSFRIPLHDEALEIVKTRMPFEFTKRMLRTEWDKARIELDMMHVTWHDLRHTTASWLVQDGVPLEVVAQILNHSRLDQTRKYAHLAPSQIDDAVASLIPGSKNVFKMRTDKKRSAG